MTFVSRWCWPSSMEEMPIAHAGQTTRITYHFHKIPYVTSIVVWRWSGQQWENIRQKLGRREWRWYNFFVKDVEAVTNYLIGEYDNHAVIQTLEQKVLRRIQRERELQDIIDEEL